MNYQTNDRVSWNGVFRGTVRQVTSDFIKVVFDNQMELNFNIDGTFFPKENPLKIILNKNDKISQRFLPSFVILE